MGLKEVVKTAREKGITDIDIRKSLKNKGYSDKEISSALGKKKPEGLDFKSVPQGMFVKDMPAQSLPFFEKLKLLLFSPVSFFDHVEEHGMGKSILMFLAVTGVMIVVGWVFSLFGLLALGRGLFPNLLGYYGLYSLAFISSIFYYIFMFVFTFVYAAIVLGVAKIFKGKGDYVETYNATIYSLIPFVILVVIPVVGGLSLIYSLVILTFGVKKYHSLTGGKAFTAAFAPFLLFLAIVAFFIFMIWLAYFGYY